MRILLGIWLLQALMVGPVWLVVAGRDFGLVALGVAMVMGAGILAALWVGTLLRDQRRLTEARHSERLAATKARFQAALAKQKTQEAEKLSLLTRKVGESRSRLLKIGLFTGGALGLGGALMVAQVFTAGLVLAAFAGGGAIGYGLRGARHRALPRVNPQPRTIDIDAEVATLAGPPEAAQSRRRGRSRLSSLRPAKP